MFYGVLAVQVTLTLIVGLAGVALLRRRAAALRHTVLLAAIGAAALVPPASAIAPVSIGIVPVPQRASITAPPVVTSPTSPTIAASDAAVAAPENGFSASSALASLWAVGAAFGLVRLARQLWELSARRRRSTVLHDRRWSAIADDISVQLALTRRVTVRVGHEREPVVAWGWLRPQVLIPVGARTWDDERVHAVVCHELAHVSRQDWLRFVLMEVVRAVYWWHPLLSIAIQQARLLAEQACDDIVLRHYARPTQYADMLVDLARSTTASPSPVVTAITPTSSLERRISAMLDATLDRSPVRHLTRCLAIAPVLAAAVAMASISARAESTHGTLSVTVRPEGGQPLAGVDVVMTTAGRPGVRARTDATGTFVMDLAPGTYRATVHVPAFNRLEAVIDMRAGESTTRELALTVSGIVQRVHVSGSPDPSAAPIDLRPDTPRVNQVGVVTIPWRIDNQRSPEYPAVLRDAGIAGTVKAAGRLGPDGHVTDVTIVESPHVGLSEAVTKYVATMRYDPVKIQGTPVSTDIVLTVDFQP